MKIRELKPYLREQKDIFKAIKKEKDTLQWGRLVTSFDTTGEKLTTLMTVIVKYAPWKEDKYLNALKSLYASIHEKINNSTLSPKAQSQLETIKSITTGTAIHTKIFTTTLTSTKATDHLQKISKEWHKEAKRNFNHAPSENKELAEDSEIVCDCLRSDIKKQKDNSVVAYDKHNNVLGIAIYKKKSIHLLGKNPTQLPKIGSHSSVHGVGTALITHIISEIKKKGKHKSIHLDALPSSVEFYKKLGFDAGKKNRKTLLTVMKLPASKIDAFLKTHGHEMTKTKKCKAKKLKAAI